MSPLLESFETMPCFSRRDHDGLVLGSTGCVRSPWMGSRMLSSAVVLAVGCPAIWIDFRTRRIPNLLVGATLLTACVVQLSLHGTAGLGLALGGAAIGLLFFPLYLAGALGAGDVKFMAALGALVGPATALLAITLTLVAGGALALTIMGWNAWASFTAPSANRMPYAAAIVIGTLAATLIAT